MGETSASAAFGPPGDRLDEVPPGARVPDRISLTDHVRAVEIGAFESERGVTQRVAFDVAVEVAPVEAGDDVDRILSYDRIAEAIDMVLKQGRVALLETLAEEVAERLLREPQALRALVRIRKLDRGPGALGVEIVREGTQVRSNWDKPTLARVVVLGPAAARDPALPRALDRLVEAGEPLLLVAPPAEAPRAATAKAQERVDRLAADQGAWLLAERDARLSVASSLTEIEWHLRRHQPAVWAPSKVSLDEQWGVRDLLTPAIFLAERIGAIEVVTIGVDLGGLMEAPLRVRRATLEEPFE